MQQEPQKTQKTQKTETIAEPRAGTPEEKFTEPSLEPKVNTSAAAHHHQWVGFQHREDDSLITQDPLMDIVSSKTTEKSPELGRKKFLRPSSLNSSQSQRSMQRILDNPSRPIEDPLRIAYKEEERERFKTTREDDSPWQPMDSSSPRVGKATPSSTPEVGGETGEDVLLPRLALSDHSPSKSSSGGSSHREPSPLSGLEPGTTTRRSLFSKDVSNSRGKSNRSPLSPTLFSRQLSASETKQEDPDLIIRLSQINGSGWSAVKEHWVNQVMQQPVEGYPARVSILHQLKLQKNKENIRAFVKEQLNRAKAAQIFLDFHQQKHKAFSTLLNEQEELDYRKTLAECLISACWAENVIGDRAAIDYYHQHKSVLMEYCDHLALEKLEGLSQRENRIPSEARQSPRIEGDSKESPSLIELSRSKSDNLDHTHSSQETLADHYRTDSPKDKTSPLVNLSVLCAREKAQTLETKKTEVIPEPLKKTPSHCCCLVS